jgi:hypothetical protein
MVAGGRRDRESSTRPDQGGRSVDDGWAASKQSVESSLLICCREGTALNAPVNPGILQPF